MNLQSDMRPAYEQEASRLLGECSGRGIGVEIVGGATKRQIGRPTNVTHTMSSRMMRGITLHEPAELVMSARAGTTVAEVMQVLARSGQMLAFEPTEYAGLTHERADGATIGAVFATNASGPRRVHAGAARDHLLGIRAVTGRGDIFKSGGRVMKNVTGYDIARGLCGSWGTLALLTEVTFKVVPMPPATTTLVLLGLPDEIAVEVLTAAMGTPYEISGAVHLQQSLAVCIDHAGLRSQGTAITALRLEITEKSVAYRREKMIAELAAYGRVHDLDTTNSLAFWDEMRRLSFFSEGMAPIWRISTAPARGAKVVQAISRTMQARAMYDWAGGLVWVEVDATADAGESEIRRVVATHGGHATLMRAEPAVRAAVDVFHPLDPGVARLTARLKSTFDPAGILNPGRMYSTF